MLYQDFNIMNLIIGFAIFFILIMILSTTETLKNGIIDNSGEKTKNVYFFLSSIVIVLSGIAISFTFFFSSIIFFPDLDSIFVTLISIILLLGISFCVGLIILKYFFMLELVPAIKIALKSTIFLIVFVLAFILM